MLYFWVLLSIVFGVVTIVMLILSLVLDPLYWIGFSLSLIATIIFIVMFFRSKSSDHSGGSDSSLDDF